MFSLIITIISIALVAALALATLYFGGDAFNQGSAKASAATVVNQASQINGANTLFYLDNSAYAAVMTDLTTDGKYLASIPNPGNAVTGSSTDVYTTDATNGLIELTSVKKSVCDSINVQAGMTVAESEALIVASGTHQFSCFYAAIGGAEVTGTFNFK